MYMGTDASGQFMFISFLYFMELVLRDLTALFRKYNTRFLNGIYPEFRLGHNSLLSVFLDKGLFHLETTEYLHQTRFLISIFGCISDVHTKIGHPVIVGLFKILELFQIVQLWVF